ncbi:MAG TPA: ABC transporter permease [Rhizomicrobium sp.]|nr:ABC transporter permease [Rhizomicrobium sp.]
MIGNYLTVALRNIARHKLYSFINIAGLAVGLACVIFIILFIRDELSFDKWLPGSDNLYRVDTAAQLPGTPMGHFALAPFPLPALMKDHLPDVMAMTRLWPMRMTVQVGDRQFPDQVSQADPNLFTVLGLPLAAGDPDQVLLRPESIVLSQSLARKYFGTADPVGRTVTVSRTNCGVGKTSCPDSMVSLRVTGVMRDLPHNTQFKIDAVIPHGSPADRIREEDKKAWFNFNGFGYVRLAPGSDPVAVATKLRQVMDRVVDFFPVIGTHRPASQILQVELVRFRDVHMNTSNTTGSRVPTGSWTTLYGLGLIGLVILLAACFNFTNLATARAMTRAREIGLRKCVGASRYQVATQFLGESVLMAAVALVFALALVEILMPAYDAFLQRPIALRYLQDWPLLLAIVLVAAAAGLVSGIYPALVLSGFRPATALRGNQSGQAGSGGLRSVLVVLQFTVSIALAIITLVVFTQIDFVRNQKLGFRRDNILVVGTGRMTVSMRESFMAQLRSHAGVAGVASSGDTPFSPSMRIETVQVPGQSATLTPEMLQITPEFIDLYDMKLATGRLLSDKRGEDIVINRPDAPNDGHNILINEAAVRYFGFTVQGATGKTIRLDKDSLHIVGVLRDVHLKGARKQVGPSLFFNDRENSNVVSIRLTGRDVPGVVAFVDRTWHRMMPSAAISRSFLDDSFEALYRADVQQGELFATFVAVAISISALGLFGLAAFTAERRTKEIGIRKVFGARTRDVVFLLLWQFSLPVVLANLIAWPLAWYYLQGWLQGFAYRITLNPFYFAAAGLAALLIAWATILGHALRVARANPIHALRYE